MTLTTAATYWFACAGIWLAVLGSSLAATKKLDPRFLGSAMVFLGILMAGLAAAVN